ncbi:MAG: hypothetical protein ACKPHU_19870, partial [Planctomycetaceae bacterium]
MLAGCFEAGPLPGLLTLSGVPGSSKLQSETHDETLFYGNAQVGTVASAGDGFWGQRMKVVDFDGSMLDATFHVIPPEDGIISLDYESSGGSHRDAIARRNHQYREGLNVLFTRLQSMNAVITEIRIETGKARFLPAAEQRIVIPNRAFPVSLAS